MVVDNSGAGIRLEEPRGCQTSPTRPQCLSAGAAAQVAACVAKQRGAANGWDERTLFLALRTCASLATKPCRDLPAVSAEQETWSSRRKAIRDYIVEQNLGLAYTMAARFSCDEVDWNDLRSEALFALVRAVEGYDLRHGFRFSTYACTAINHALIRAARLASEHRARVREKHQSSFEKPGRADRWSELYIDRLDRALDENRAGLTYREEVVLNLRFPRDGSRCPSLEEVGRVLGLSKEGARRIQERVLHKLRLLLEADPVLK